MAPSHREIGEPNVGPAASSPSGPPEDLTWALEEACGVLIVLEASRARLAALPSDVGEAEAKLSEALGAVRRTIETLRSLMQGNQTRAIPDGFVVGTWGLVRS